MKRFSLFFTFLGKDQFYTTKYLNRDKIVHYVQKSFICVPRFVKKLLRTSKYFYKFYSKRTQNQSVKVLF